MLEAAMDADRVRRIRQSLADNSDMVKYAAPWDSDTVISESSIDLLLSHAVMEHVPDVGRTYELIRMWLKDGGIASHVIDLRCHGISSKWNAHWGCGDLLWHIIKGRRPYFINRLPCSEHETLMSQAGFTLLDVSPTLDHSGLERRQLARPFQAMSDSDLATCGVSLVGRKG